MSLDVRLPIDVYSPDQLSALLLELRHFTGQQRNAAIQAKAGAPPEATEASPALLGLLKGCGVAADDTSTMEDLHKTLSDLLKTAPVMHVTLAAMPGRTLKRQLTVWFRTQISPSVLLTFAARSDIGGGIILQAGSHLYDYSFRARILANPKRIGELAGV